MTPFVKTYQTINANNYLFLSIFFVNSVTKWWRNICR